MNTSALPNEPVKATWAADGVEHARAVLDERGFPWHVGALDKANLIRIRECGWPLWIKMANDQLVCIRAKRAA